MIVAGIPSLLSAHRCACRVARVRRIRTERLRESALFRVTCRVLACVSTNSQSRTFLIGRKLDRRVELSCRGAREGSDLYGASVYEQFNACNEACFVGCEEGHSSRDFFGPAETAKRDRR